MVSQPFLAHWLRHVGRIGFILLVLFGSSGCMEALQTGPLPGGPPAANSAVWPTEPSVTATVPAPPAAASATPAAENTALPAPTVTVPPPTEIPPALPTLALPTQPAVSNEERWRAQQVDRQVFDPLQPYGTVTSELWWYDPVNQQSIVLGSFSGAFVAQARFSLRGQGIEALEVPYQVNRSYGLTALSPAVLERIRVAGYGEWIETYVFVTPNVTPR